MPLGGSLGLKRTGIDSAGQLLLPHFKVQVCLPLETASKASLSWDQPFFSVPMDGREEERPSLKADAASGPCGASEELAGGETLFSEQDPSRQGDESAGAAGSCISMGTGSFSRLSTWQCKEKERHSQTQRPYASAALINKTPRTLPKDSSQSPRVPGQIKVVNVPLVTKWGGVLQHLGDMTMILDKCGQGFHTA